MRRGFKTLFYYILMDAPVQLTDNPQGCNISEAAQSHS